MKKIIPFALLLAVMGFVAACGEKTTGEKAQDAMNSAKDDANKAVEGLQGK